MIARKEITIMKMKTIRIKKKRTENSAQAQPSLSTGMESHI
jgi:hypothetical protein